MGCCKGWANLNLTYGILKRLSPGWESRRQDFWGWKWEREFLARLIRSPGSPRRREGSEALKKEIGVWTSQGGEKDKHFSLSPELMITQQNNSFFWVQFSSVAQSCPTLCDPMDCSMPGFPVHHQLPEFTQTHVHWVSDVIQPISSSVISFSSHLQSFPAPRSFQMSQLLASGGQSIGVSASISVLPMNTQDWFPLGWTGWISLQSNGLSRVFSNTKVQNINSLVLSFLYSPTLTSIHDYWKNHSLDWMDLCWQSNVSAF